MPNLFDSILFIEDDNIVGEYFGVEFDRNLQSLMQQPNFNSVKGIVIGRFQESSKMSLEKLKYIIETKRELKNIPIVANVDFGHTNPIITFPVGGTARLIITDKVELKIIKH